MFRSRLPWTHKYISTFLFPTDRGSTNVALEQMTWWPPVEVQGVHLNNKEDFAAFLWNFRKDVSAGRVGYTKSIEVYSDLNDELLTESLALVHIPSSDTASEMLFAFNVLLRATENAGIGRAVGSTYFVPCYMSNDKRHWVEKLEARVQTYVDLGIHYYPIALDIHQSILAKSPQAYEAIFLMEDHMTNVEYYPVCQRQSMDARFLNAQHWFRNKTVQVEDLKELQTFTAHNLIDIVAEVRFYSPSRLIRTSLLKHNIRAADLGFQTKVE